MFSSTFPRIALLSVLRVRVLDVDTDSSPLSSETNSKQKIWYKHNIYIDRKHKQNVCVWCRQKGVKLSTESAFFAVLVLVFVEKVFNARGGCIS